MSYLRNANRHIVSSYGMHKKKRNSSGLFVIVAGVLVLVGIFFALRNPISGVLFSIRELIVPNSTGQVYIEESALASRMAALEIENSEFKALLEKTGVMVTGDTAVTSGEPVIDNGEAGNGEGVEIEDSVIIDPETGLAVTASSTTGETTQTTSVGAARLTKSGSTSLVHKLSLEGDEVITNVLVRPPQSPFDALVIGAGSNGGLAIGDQVYAFSGFPIGEIVSVEKTRATVRLLSAPGSRIEVLVGTSTEAVTAEGKGGGNFFLKLPKVSEIHVGDVVARNFLPPETFSTIESVDSEAGEAYIYAYFKLPIKLSSLVYVIVKTNSDR